MALIIGIALAGAVGLFARISGFDRSRAFYPTVLIVVASYYVLFTLMDGRGGTELVPELLAFLVFAALAVWGFRTSMWIVAAGLVLHGVFDVFRHSLLAGGGVPAWWPGFCAGYDVVAGMILAALLLTRRLMDDRLARH